MSEAKMWNKLQKNSKSGLICWKVLSDKYGVGIPDRTFILSRSDKFTGFVELKWIKEWPVTGSAGTSIGLRREQALWLEDWCKHGGNAFVLLGIGKENLVFFKKDFMGLSKNGITRDTIMNNTVYDYASYLAYFDQL